MFDFLNQNGMRNSRNSDEHDYNCFGFACRTYGWTCPYQLGEDVDDYDYNSADTHFGIAEEMLSQGYSTDEIYQCIMIHDIDIFKQMYREYITFYNSAREVPDDVELVAYKFFIELDEDEEEIYDTDFHFRVRRDGIWQEKCGSRTPRVCDSGFDSYWENGTLCYDSETLLFSIDPSFFCCSEIPN